MISAWTVPSITGIEARFTFGKGLRLLASRLMTGWANLMLLGSYVLVCFYSQLPSQLKWQFNHQPLVSSKCRYYYNVTTRLLTKDDHYNRLSLGWRGSSCNILPRESHSLRPLYFTWRCLRPRLKVVWLARDKFPLCWLVVSVTLTYCTPYIHCWTHLFASNPKASAAKIRQGCGVWRNYIAPVLPAVKMVSILSIYEQRLEPH